MLLIILQTIYIIEIIGIFPTMQKAQLNPIHWRRDDLSCPHFIQELIDLKFEALLSLESAFAKTSTSAEAEPVSFAPRLTSVMSVATWIMPLAASPTLRAISKHRTPATRRVFSRNMRATFHRRAWERLRTDPVDQLRAPADESVFWSCRRSAVLALIGLGSA